MSDKAKSIETLFGYEFEPLAIDSNWNDVGGRLHVR